MVVKNSWKIIVAGLLLVACSEPENTVTEETAGARSGAKIYKEHCTVCHGDDGTLGAAGAKDLSRSGLSDNAVTDILKNGKNAMPKQDRFIQSQEEYDNLIEHLKTLRK